MADPRRCWDNTAVRSWFTGDAGSGATAAMELARNGETKIYVSSVCVISSFADLWRGLTDAQQFAIHDFFRVAYVKVYELHLGLAEFARDLLVSHELTAEQAIHAATALHVKAALETYDPVLLALSGQIGGAGPRLLIRKPGADTPGQINMLGPDQLHAL